MSSTSGHQGCKPGEYYLRLPRDFHYPIDLLQRVYDQQVVLEHIFTRGLTAYGTIRVTNRAFDKRVSVRYSIDQWKTSSVQNARYVRHYFDNNTDIFHFKLIVPKEKLSLPMTLSFAICFHVDQEEFWDNNFSQNYTLDIIERKITSISDQLSSKELIGHNDILHRQIAQEYHAIPRTFPQLGNLCGLRNLDGTCFMNSVLQSLSFTSLLTDYFFSNKDIKDGIVVNEYLNLLHLLFAGKYAVVTPRAFQQIIGYRVKGFGGDQQQDSHEFLMLLLDILHEDLIQSKSLGNAVTDNRKTNHSIILDLFYGTYRSTTTCLTCEQASYNLEPFVSLTVPIPSMNQCTLEDCLVYLNVEEYLSDDSQWFCPSCHCLRDAKKRLEIYKLPKILIIQLKRFQMNFEHQLVKNDTIVLYPEDNFHLHQHCSSQPSLYTLYSIINHSGSLDDGHYTTFSRNIASNSPFWFEIDDETINYLPSDLLNPNPKAYILFYMLKQTTELMNMTF